MGRLGFRSDLPAIKSLLGWVDEGRRNLGRRNMEFPTINWEGASGRTYLYHIIPWADANLQSIPGNYIYAKEVSPNQWAPVYIGQTSNLADRIEGHNKEACVRRNGATHIHAHASENREDVRRAEESDLIERWDSPCNL